MPDYNDGFLGVFEEHEFARKLERLIPDDEMRERFMAGLTFVLSHDPLCGELTSQPGVLGLPSQGKEYGFPTPIVVYYSFDQYNIYLQDVEASH